MNAAAASDPPTTAPIALWRVAAAFMHILYSLFGAPADIARQHALTAKAHALMSSWLACGEALMRRLILIEAAAFPKPNARPPAPGRARTPARRDNAGDPESWRVVFRCMGADARPKQGAASARALPGWRARFRPSWPLAARYEALTRVFNRPLAYAQRLARRLHAAVVRQRALRRAPPQARHRIDLYDMLLACAEGAASVFAFDTS